MRPHDGKLKKFKLDPKYVHKRSEGLTRRTNGGSYLQLDAGNARRGEGPPVPLDKR